MAKTNGDREEDFEINTLTIGNDAAEKAVVNAIVGSVGSKAYNISLITRATALGLSRITLKEDGSSVLCYIYDEKLYTNSAGVYVNGSYQPFTGTHIATSSEQLKIGELVSISSTKLDEKQPIWVADYCVDAKKGVFGVVYDIVYKKELYTVEEERKVIDKKGVEKTKKINVTKERNTNIIEYYLIAAVGDAVVNFSNENGECELGDYLIPSATKKGCVMVHRGDFIPLNQCGKAGEATNENKLIAWVKE